MQILEIGTLLEIPGFCFKSRLWTSLPGVSLPQRTPLLPENGFENVHLLFQFEFFSFEGLMRFPKVALRDSIFERLRNRSVANGDAFNEVIRVPIDAETIEAALARHPSGGCKARVDLHPRALSSANSTRWLVCY